MAPAFPQQVSWLALAAAVLLLGCAQSGVDPPPAVQAAAPAAPVAASQAPPVREALQMRAHPDVNPAVLATLESFLPGLAPDCRVGVCRNDPTMATAECMPVLDGPIVLLDNRTGEVLLQSVFEVGPERGHTRADRSLVPPREAANLHARCDGRWSGGYWNLDPE